MFPDSGGAAPHMAAAWRVGTRDVRLARGGGGCEAGLNPRPRSLHVSTLQAVRAAIAALLSALLALLLIAGGASAATDHVVITGGAVVPAGQTAGDVIVVDGGVRIDGRATGDVVSVSGPIRVAGRVDGDVIAVSDRAILAPSARVGGDLRYGDERPVIRRERAWPVRSARRTGPTQAAGGAG